MPDPVIVRCQAEGSSCVTVTYAGSRGMPVSIDRYHCTHPNRCSKMPGQPGCQHRHRLHGPHRAGSAFIDIRRLQESGSA